MPPYWGGVATLVAKGVSDVWALSHQGRPLFDFVSSTLPPDVIVITRLSMALAGALTVFVTYLIGRRLFGDLAGLLAALFLAASPLHVLKSQEAVCDTLLTFWATVTVWLALRARERPTFARLRSLHDSSDSPGCRCDGSLHEVISSTQCANPGASGSRFRRSRMDWP